MKLEVKPEDVLNSIFNRPLELLKALKLAIGIAESNEQYISYKCLDERLQDIVESLRFSVNNLKSRIKE